MPPIVVTASKTRVQCDVTFFGVCFETSFTFGPNVRKQLHKLGYKTRVILKNKKISWTKIFRGKCAVMLRKCINLFLVLKIDNQYRQFHVSYFAVCYPFKTSV